MTDEIAMHEELMWHWLGLTDDRIDWHRTIPGPTVDEVAHRMSSIPVDFLAPTFMPRAFLADVGAQSAEAEVSSWLALDHTPEGRVRTGIAVAQWLWADEVLTGPMSVVLSRRDVVRPMGALALRLSSVVPAQIWLSDDIRRAEAARTFLAFSGQYPHDEDAGVAKAQFALHDSVARATRLRAALQDQQHRERVMRRLNDQRAREAAARYNPQ